MGEWFYIVTESMLRLGLRGTELSVFAILNGFSQKNAGCFFGTRKTLADYCGVSSKRTIDSAIDALLEKGLIRRYTIIRDGKEMVAYEVQGKFIQDLNDIKIEGAFSAPGGCNICTGGGANSAPMENKEKKTKEKYNTRDIEFKESLLSLGVSEEVAEAWMSVRKTKRATNTEIAFRKVAEEIQKSGKTAEECITIAVENSWQGFKAEWVTSKSHSRQNTPSKKEDKPFSFNKHF